MSKINERQIGLKTGGNYTLLKDYLDRIKAVQCPFNETQTLTGLSADDGAVIDASLIPANGNIGDNAVISDGLYTSTAREGGIISAEGTETTGFDTPGSFVHDIKTVSDDYGNILNAVQIRDEATHDSVLDADGRAVFGLIVRCFGVADDTAVAAAASENLEICFVVNDGTGTLAKANGGVTGSIEFNFNRAFAERFQSKIALDGGNASDVDVLVGTGIDYLATFTVTTAFVDEEVFTISTGAGGVAGVTTPAGDYAAIASWFDAEGKFNEKDFVILLNGVEQLKGDDISYSASDAIELGFDADIGDVITIKANF
jgi:hypothetical protein